MKKCINCGKENDDQAQFCNVCGGKLVGFQKTFCKNCGAENNENATFCARCGSPLSGTNYQTKSAMPDTTPYQGAKSNQMNAGVMIAIIVALIAIFAVVFVVVISLKRDSSFMKNSSKPASSAAAQQDLSTYQNYYDGIDNAFNGLIISSLHAGEVDTYKTALGDALTSKNEENCKYNYDKLLALQDDLTSSSQEKISSLTSQLSQLEQSKKVKKAKKGTEYKKDKNLAKNAENKQDYANAKTYYEACIDILKKAKKKAVSQNTSGSTYSNANTDWYTTGAIDDTTYYAVYNNYLDSSVVSGFSKEQKRYYMNTLFAAYGYRFNNDSIQSFYNSQTWYHPDYNIHVGDQAAIQRMFDDMCKYNYDLLKG